MYWRRCHRIKDGKRRAYWALVKSLRTAKGPRQEVVAYLGDLDEAGRLGVQQAARGDDPSAQQRALFDTPRPRYVEVDVSGVVVAGMRKFVGPLLALQLIGPLGLRSALDRLLPAGRAEVPWSLMAQVLVICRLCAPSGDCKQVCIGLVVSRCGMPRGYELFAGNKTDVTTVQQIVTTMEQRYGKADRVWVMDRGRVSAANVEFLKEDGRRYIMGTHKP
jgi:hypothetical protein